MLTGQQSGWRHHHHLFASHGHNKSRAQRHFGFAEAHIAAHQAIHGAPGNQVGHNFFDGLLLVVGHVMGEPGAEFVVQTGRRHQLWRSAQLPRRCQFQQLPGDFSDAFFSLGLAPLPTRAAKAIQSHMACVGPIPGNHLDVFHRQEQAIISVVHQGQAIMGSPVHIQNFQSGKPADAMVHVNHQIAEGQAGCLPNEVLGSARFARRPGQTLPQNVLLADDRLAGGFKPVVQA